MVPETAPRAWRTRGLRPEDAPLLFDEAAALYAELSPSLDAWGRAAFSFEALRGFAEERRRLLHRLLDRALDVVELVTVAERGAWP